MDFSTAYKLDQDAQHTCCVKPDDSLKAVGTNPFFSGSRRLGIIPKAILMGSLGKPHFYFTNPTPTNKVRERSVIEAEAREMNAEHLPLLVPFNELEPALHPD
jgi:hypothetical protein